MELVSILVPCYNHEKYIDDCMSSLCAQTYPEIELIIVDDCSKDGSYKKLQTWLEKLEKRFTAVSLDKNEINQGVTKNLNRMLEKAKGTYIKILASDDMLVPTAIENFVTFAERNQSDIIFSNVSLVKENAHYPLSDLDTHILFYQKTPPYGEKLTGIICGDNYIPAPGVFIPKKTYDQYGVFDEKYILEDFEYWLRVSVRGTFGYLDKVTALYRQNDNSLSRFNFSDAAHRRHRTYCENKMEIFDDYKKYANQEQISLFYNNELRSAIGMNDQQLVARIIKKMHVDCVTLSNVNKLRLCCMKLNIYILMKKIKKHFK